MASDHHDSHTSLGCSKTTFLRSHLAIFGKIPSRLQESPPFLISPTFPFPCRIQFVSGEVASALVALQLPESFAAFPQMLLCLWRPEQFVSLVLQVLAATVELLIVLMDLSQAFLLDLVQLLVVSACLIDSGGCGGPGGLSNGQEGHHDRCKDNQFRHCQWHQVKIDG